MRQHAKSLKFRQVWTIDPYKKTYTSKQETETYTEYTTIKSLLQKNQMDNIN